MFLQRCLPLVASALVCPALFAQFTAAKITFRNPGALTQGDLEASADLHAGQKTSLAGIKAAAQRIIGTGYFDDVGVDSAGSPAALNVIFILKPIDPARMTGAGFENIVWLTPEEIAATLHKAAPLFHGQLPDAGDQIDAITNGLQAALAATGVNAEITHETLQQSLIQPVRTVEFRVDNPVVRVHAITLQGGVPELAAATAKTTEKLRGSRYSEGSDSANTLHAVLAPYLDAGYLDAHLTGLQRTLVQNTPTDATVDLTASIEPGKPYKVAAIIYEGTPLVARDVVMGAAKLHPGDLASTKLLLDTLSPIDTAYRRQGYMDVLVDPGAKLDPVTQAVTYTVRVVSGAPYHLRTVKPFNLSDEARKDFDASWQMKPGDLYDSMYVADFMKHNLAMHALRGYSAAYEAVADPETHQVDLNINFVRIGR